MEANHEITSYKEANENLGVNNFLNKYKESLSRRFKTPEEVLEHDIYTMGDFVDLPKDPNFSDQEARIISVLSGAKGNELPDELLESIEQYFQKVYRQERSNPKELKSSEPIAKLRRTLALIYKAAQIPNIQTDRGGSKDVVGPIGLDVSKERPISQQIIDNIDSIWLWDGNLPGNLDLENWQPHERRNFVLIQPINPDKMRNTDFDTSKTLMSNKDRMEREFNGIQDLSKKLLHPTYLPEVIQKTEHAWFVESINGRMPAKDDSEKVEDLVDVTNNLEELWKDGGVIFTDIKIQNIRRRKTGETVIIDFGSRQDFEPGTENFVRSNREFTVPYTPSEIAKQIQNGTQESVNAEKFIAYQIGILTLQSYVPSDIIEDTLDIFKDRKFGFKWNAVLKEGGPRRDVFSVNQDTVLDILQQHPEIKIPPEIKDLLIYMLSDNPDHRPSLDKIRNTFKESLSSLKNSEQKTPA